MRYRKKPVEIEALQWDGTMAGAMEIKAWSLQCGFEEIYFVQDRSGTKVTMTVKTLEGAMKVSPQDYVIRGVAGEFYPCKPDIFELSYDAYEDER